MMKSLYQFGLLFGVNLAIVIVGILPGMSVPIVPVITSSEKKEEPRVLISEVVNAIGRMKVSRSTYIEF